jgi:DNA-binding winged helix-turn-helix (wHTH) protein
MFPSILAAAARRDVDNLGFRTGADNGLGLPCASPESVDGPRYPARMAMRPGTARFGPFEADLRTGELCRDGEPVELQELPFRILAALLERPGELVTREELREVAWPGGEFVDFDHGLNKAVNKIRRALGDSADAPRYLETLPGRGYRFAAPVASLSLAGAGPGGEVQGGSPGAAARGSCRILWDSRTIPLSEGENVIGRDPGVAVWVDSTTVSRRHALILVTRELVTLHDLGSKNGTFLRGERVDAPTPLADGDELAVGSARMVFHCSMAASTRTATG